MEIIKIQGAYRQKSGKGPARELRRQGKIPAVIYSKGTSKSLVLDPKELNAVRHSSAGENAVMDVQVMGADQSVVGSHTAILRDFQRDPVSGAILHADLFEISMSDLIDVKVLIEITGSTPIGVKRDNGSLRQQLREVEVRCLPDNIPGHLDVDASDLEVGQTIHVSDISLPEGVTVLSDGGLAVVSVTTTISDEQLEEMLSSTPGEETAPEVTSEKNTDEEEKK